MKCEACKPKVRKNTNFEFTRKMLQKETSQYYHFSTMFQIT